MQVLFFIIYFPTMHLKDNCTMPEIPKFGIIENPSEEGYLVGSSLKILGACGPGSYFTRTCLDNSSWSMPTICKETHWCKYPALKNHSEVDNPKEMYMLNETIIVTCEEGYVHGHQREYQCQPDRTWGVELPTCILNRCPQNCLPGQICNDTDNACPYGKCKTSYWGRHCQYSKQCRTTAKGEEYRGSKNVTAGGHICQMWRSNTPQNHGNKFLDLPENYCRNPDGEPAPWCYTTTKEIRWEICHVPFCGDQCPPPPLSINTDVINIPADGFDFGYKIMISGTKCGTGLVGTRKCIVQKFRRWSEANCEAVECKVPVLSNNSYIVNKKDVYVYGDIITVRCNQGFQPSGGQRFQCQDNAAWNGTIPACNIISCLKPRLSRSAQIKNPTKEKYFFNQSIDLTCEDGYEMRNSSTITCLANRTWGNIPECTVLECSKPPLPPHSFINHEQSTYRVNDTLSVNCHPGYYQVGIGILRCLYNGRWNGTIPKCEAMECNDFRLANHTHLDFPRNVTYHYGDTIKLRCDPGYEIIGIATASCNVNQSWGILPSCEAITCSLPNLTTLHSIKLQRSSDIKLGGKIEIVCIEGFAPAEKQYLECKANGFWEGVVPDCKGISCSPPPIDNYSIISPIKLQYRYGDIVNVSCHGGYQLFGDRIFQCTINGIWNGSMPVCTAVKCGLPALLDNHVLKLMNLSSFDVGGHLTVLCKEGFFSADSGEMKCLENGVWLGSLPKCESIQCRLPTVENVILLQQEKESYSYKETIMLTCKDGYMPQINFIFECQQNRYWNGTLPICTEIWCPNPVLSPFSILKSPIVKKEKYSYLDTIKVSCSQGYNVIGQSRFHCQNNGSWNGVMPSCQAIRCTVPILSENATIIMKGEKDFLPGGHIKIGCFEGFSVKGSQILTCQQDRSWKGSIPVCEEITCTNPASPINNLRVIPRNKVFHYGESIKVLCNEGFTTKEDTFLVCGGSGTWNGIMPHCEAVLCLPPSLQNNSHLLNPKMKNYLYMDLIQVVCVPGFVIKGSDTFQCQSNGLWNGTMPYCTAKSCPIPQVTRDKYLVISNKRDLEVGGSLVVKCVDGMRPASDYVLQCLGNGKWNKQVPDCEVMKCTLPSINDNSYIEGITSSSYKYRADIRIVCKAGFKMRGNGVFTCEHDGTWNGSMPYCDAISCTLPNLSKNNRIVSGNFQNLTVGSVVQIGCTFGTEPAGFSTLTCMPNGTWNGTLPKCQATKCLNPVIPSHSFIAAGSKKQYSFGDRVTVNCRSNDDSAAATQLQCQQSRWIGNLPVCREISCKLPEIFDGIQIILNSSSSFRPGGIIIAQCIGGRQNQAFLQCLRNGKWNDSPPICQDMKCQQPKLEGNSFVEYGEKTFYYIDDRIYIKCKKGFRMNGQNTRRCTESLEWDRAMPICEREDASQVSTPKMSSVVVGVISASVSFVFAAILSIAIMIILMRYFNFCRFSNLRKEKSKPRTSFTRMRNLSKSDVPSDSTIITNSTNFQNPLLSIPQDGSSLQ